MSCREGEPCLEARKRKIAIVVLVLMGVLFIALSLFSFVPERGQTIPTDITFGEYDGVDGRRVFQAYNCMGCHTIMGNGAYLGPDLTDTYEHAGPAWLAAFLPSAGGWPTEAAVRAKLLDPVIAADAGTSDIAEYLVKYPGAQERITRRGGQTTLMPNLPFKGDEIGKLIAFLKYTSAIHTEGWPPKPKIDGVAYLQAQKGMTVAAASTTTTDTATENVITQDPVKRGEQLAQEQGCMACHATTGERRVGPGWGGLYNTQDHKTSAGLVLVDEAYLRESILDPNAQITDGYVPGLMPPYAGLLSDEDVDAIVAYIAHLQGGAQ